MKKFLMIIGGVVVALIILFVVIFFVTSITSDKLVCKSAEGNITIMYNDEKITGYTASGMTYDLNGQKKLAEKIGVVEYIDEFSTWFETNTTGSCEK